MRPEIMEGIQKHIKALGGFEEAEILEIEPGHARIKIPVGQEALNLYGNIHGGFLYTLCDTVAGMSTYACEVSNVSLQGNINFIRPFQTGILYVEGNAIHKGRQTFVIQVSVTSENGKTIAAASFTMFVTGAL